MISALLTTLVILIPLGGLLRGLRHPLYALHVTMVAAEVLALQYYHLGDVEPFNTRLLMVLLAVHIASINAVTYLAYYLDKRASKRGAWRIPERTLHHFALAGGSPAALLAQKQLRHKTKKQSFRTVFWLIALLQIVAIIAIALKLGFNR